MKSEARKSTQRRRYNRVPATGTVGYAIGASHAGTATLVDVDQSGVCVTGGRRFVPGQRLMLTVEKPLRCGQDVELKGRVAWCHPAETPGEYRAGIRIYRTDAEARLALCVLVNMGLKRAVAVTRSDDPRMWITVKTWPREETIDLSNIWRTTEQHETQMKQASVARF